MVFVEYSLFPSMMILIRYNNSLFHLCASQKNVISVSLKQWNEFRMKFHSFIENHKSKMFWGKMKRAQNCIEMIENQSFGNLIIPMCIWKMLIHQKQQWTKRRKEIQSFHNLAFWSLYCSISLFCVIIKHNMLNTTSCLLNCWVHLPSAFLSLLYCIISLHFYSHMNST